MPTNIISSKNVHKKNTHTSSHTHTHMHIHSQRWDNSNPEASCKQVTLSFTIRTLQEEEEEDKMQML